MEVWERKKEREGAKEGLCQAASHGTGQELLETLLRFVGHLVRYLVEFTAELSL